MLPGPGAAGPPPATAPRVLLPAQLHPRAWQGGSGSSSPTTRDVHRRQRQCERGCASPGSLSPMPTTHLSYLFRPRRDQTKWLFILQPLLPFCPVPRWARELGSQCAALHDLVKNLVLRLLSVPLFMHTPPPASGAEPPSAAQQQQAALAAGVAHPAHPPHPPPPPPPAAGQQWQQRPPLEMRIHVPWRRSACDRCRSQKLRCVRAKEDDTSRPCTRCLRIGILVSPAPPNLRGERLAACVRRQSRLRRRRQPLPLGGKQPDGG